ncbi:unnamed protein product (macronuclear) [Paramecium tetraurelia]|uniref:Trichohyalin-plectin-homology domain-containing protein n=1 Tax=Paramecium tetraurelia TaxID=5888 RepID=A0E9S9_PARTE|nr:uncharacterized protein GSPATT00024777001 [Paramecium tetraurelia]CAK92046.1 unnamed protein product [Paramecium tetraurelia]|eukprot:XP_001459443.1 hypothetical protein (macronuclear) [Paramecium tetraurelia strain d4-2]
MIQSQKQQYPYWSKMLENQLQEKQQNDFQFKQDQELRKQRYKQELQTDMMLHQQKKQVQQSQNQQLESIMLETLRQRESKKLKEMEERKIKQIQTSLDNLNNLMIKKKMNLERSYNNQQLDKEFIRQEQMREMKTIEEKKQKKEEEAKLLKVTYDDMINNKRQLRQELQQNAPTSIPTLINEQSKAKIDTKKYQVELQKQLEQKQKQLEELRLKKIEERQKVEQKIEFEKQKMMENKLKNYQAYKQYETENYELLLDRKQQQQSNPSELKLLQNPSQSKLPRIYQDNYYPIERKKQLELLDRDLLKYQLLQQQQNIINHNHTILSPVQDKVQDGTKSESSKQTKQSKQSKQASNTLNQLVPQQQQQQQVQVSTPSQKSRNSKLNPQNPIVHLNQRYVPKKRSFNIVTGIITPN